MPKYSTAPFQEPTQKKTRKADLWCPYCGEWRTFKMGEYGYKRCPVCAISTADFWVKMANYRSKKSTINFSWKKDLP